MCLHVCVLQTSARHIECTVHFLHSTQRRKPHMLLQHETFAALKSDLRSAYENIAVGAGRLLCRDQTGHRAVTQMFCV
jgi:hypothetical protein